MKQEDLQAKLSEMGTQLEVPGVAAGIYHDGQEHYAFHGVTSVENPLDVDENTLFQFGSTGKTFTATAIMRLVEQGKLDLDERVKTYVPELKLKDKQAENEVKLLQLLNHTAGWQGDLLEPTGEGDDALEKYVALMGTIEQVTPLGTAISYNNASLSLAGRVIEKITGQTFEQAMKELIFEPLGLNNSFFFMNDIMTRRFAVGHNQAPDGTIKVARPWHLARGGYPAGGISANAADQIAWAHFHLGDGKGADGSQVLSKDSLDQMKVATFDAPGSAIGDAVGISWMLRDVDGVGLVAHGGDTIGQHSAFLMVPERDFAVIVMTNCGPNGSQLNEDLVKWALESYIGVKDVDPEPEEKSDEELAPYLGTYETIAAKVSVTAEKGGLMLKAEVDTEVLKKIMEVTEEDIKEMQNQPPLPVGMLPGPGDRYIVKDGPAKGMKGYFVRDDAGKVTTVHVGGRLATKVD